MVPPFWPTVGLALRQWLTLEALGLALLQAAIDLLLITAAGQWSLIGRGYSPLALQTREMNFSAGLASAVTLPVVVLLLDRLVRRRLGLAMPVGAVHGALRLIKANILGSLTLIAVTVIPLALLGLAIRLALPEAMALVATPALMLAAAALLVLSAIYAFYPLGVLYRGYMSFAEARQLSRGWRWRLLLGIGLIVLALTVGLVLLLLLVQTGLRLAGLGTQWGDLLVTPLALSAYAPLVIYGVALYQAATARLGHWRPDCDAANALPS